MAKMSEEEEEEEILELRSVEVQQIALIKC